MRLRALVLAAGRGERLRPLTLEIPKPLLPVRGRTVLQRTLDHIAAQCPEIEGVALNLHHLGDAIHEHIGDRHGRLAVTYSRERDELLGTWGAVGPLRHWLGEADLVLLVNGDTLCAWPFARLVAAHCAERTRNAARGRAAPAATVLLASRPDPGRFGGGVAVDSSGRVLSFRGAPATPLQNRTVARRCVFAGAHLFDTRLLDRAKNDGRPADIISAVYEPLLAAGEEILSITTRGRWHDLGTPARYLDAVLDWPDGPRRGAGARLGKGARVTNSILEDGVEISAGARIDSCLVMTGGLVRPNEQLRRTIVTPGGRRIACDE